MSQLLYELPIFEHVDAQSVQEAVTCLRRNGEKAKVIAGGTDLLALMKDRVEGPQMKVPEVLINIKPIPEIQQITHEPGIGLKIGAAVLLRHLETSGIIKERFPILSQATEQVGTTQLRNMGTMGGNICQRPRCLYFRHPHFPCYKKGGTQCYAATGEHRFYHSILKNGKCVMACPSDIAPTFVALQAKAIIHGYDGQRAIPFQDFFQGVDPLTETVLKKDEILTAVQVPDLKWTHQVFLKKRIRHAVDFSLASVAMVAQIADKFCQDIHIVLGGVAPFPYVASKAAEIVRGSNLTEKIVSQAAEAALGEARPLPGNGYKIDLTRALISRALASLR